LIFFIYLDLRRATAATPNNATTITRVTAGYNKSPAWSTSAEVFVDIVGVRVVIISVETTVDAVVIVVLTVLVTVFVTVVVKTV
jgi:hypothetical protein